MSFRAFFFLYFFNAAIHGFTSRQGELGIYQTPTIRMKALYPDLKSNPKSSKNWDTLFW